MEKLLNEENTRDNATTCKKVEGLCELIRRGEILKALRMMKKDKAAGRTGIISEMFMADEDCSMEWSTSLGKGESLMTGTVVFCYQFSKGK